MTTDAHDLNRLLTANRKLIRLCCLQAVLLAAFAVVGWQYQSNELTLRRLAIVDSNGRERVVLRGGDDGQGLVLVDSKGVARCGLTVDSDNPGMRMYDGKGQARAAMVINPDGPAIQILSPNGSYVDTMPRPVKRILR
jgi:hypothetical protein